MICLAVYEIIKRIRAIHCFLSPKGLNKRKWTYKTVNRVWLFTGDE